MPDPKAKVAAMIQPESLRSENYQPWSRGRGVDVWEMICASITGDLSTVKRLAAKDTNLVTCEYEYFTPVRFAVRENQRAVVDYLIERGADPICEIGDSPLGIARERGYTELAAFLEKLLQNRYRIDPGMRTVAEAIKARDLPRAQRLLEQRPELIHSADDRGNQPLHWAVMTRQLPLIDYLLEHRADINARRPDGLRPIHLTNGDYHYRGWRDLPASALQKHEVVVGYLLARGADYDIATASRFGDLFRVRQLLDQDPALVRAQPGTSYYIGLPLRAAAGGGHLEVVKLLLERGADPNEPEPGIAPQGGALHCAIGGKHLEVVKVLLEHGANPNAEVESSGNCMSMAKHVGAPKEMVDLIASYGGVMGAEFADVETLAAMFHANPQLEIGERLDTPELRRLVLRYHPDILKRNLDPAAWWNMATPPTAELARWAMEHGLDPNRRNWLGITLLHRCAGKGRREIAQVCLDFGADINAIETEWSSTPLGWAARAGNKEMVEWLLNQGADPRLPQDEPWALPIAWARRRGHNEVVKLLGS